MINKEIEILFKKLIPTDATNIIPFDNYRVFVYNYQGKTIVKTFDGIVLCENANKVQMHNKGFSFVDCNNCYVVKNYNNEIIFKTKTKPKIYNDYVILEENNKYTVKTWDNYLACFDVEEVKIYNNLCCYRPYNEWFINDFYKKEIIMMCIDKVYYLDGCLFIRTGEYEYLLKNVSSTDTYFCLELGNNK